MAKNPYWMIAADGIFFGVVVPTCLLVVNLHGLEKAPPAGTHSAVPKEIQDTA